jgi:hypothetical protein
MKTEMIDVPSTKEIVLRVTNAQARAWLALLEALKASVYGENYDRINRLTLQLECALDNTEAFGVLQGAGVAHVEVSK